MGLRAQIEVKQQPHSVFLYTHWGADEILQDVIKGMIKGKLRWNDPTYLTRILFDSIKKGDDSTKSFGIGTFQAGDIEKLIIVDIEHQEIRYYAVNSNIDQDRLLISEHKFEEFVDPIDDSILHRC